MPPRWDGPRDVADPPLSRLEELTDQFYEWERRGRGWKVWPHAVALEPPFVPFDGHFLPTDNSTPDDGRRPTFLSQLTEWVLGNGGSHPGTDPKLPARIGTSEPAPELEESGEELIELRVSLPPEQDVSPASVEQMLLALPCAARPVAFEVLGVADAIWVQFACGKGIAELLTQLLRAHWPQATVTGAPQPLEQLWNSGGGDQLVVEFGLSEEFMLPLRHFGSFSVDPLAGLFAGLSDLRPGEFGCFQVLFQHARAPWAENIVRAVLDDEGGPFFFDAPDLAKQAHQKISRPLFAAVIRVASRSPELERTVSIARSLGWWLNTLANPPCNRLIPLENRAYPDAAHIEDFLHRRSRRSGVLLSSAELVGLVHPPSRAVQMEKLCRESRRTTTAPRIATGHAYLLGTNSHGGSSQTVGLSEEQRTRHVYIVGASGTGKSTLLQNLVLQDLHEGHGLALLDPHGDLVDEVLRRMPESRVGDVAIIDPGDSSSSVGLNILSSNSELERTLLASDLVGVFRRLSTSWGDQMTSVLGNAILAFLENARGGTLLDLRRFLVEPSFRREVLQTTQDEEVRYFWEREFPLLRGNPQASILTRLDTLLRPRPVRRIVAEKDSCLDLRRMMDERRVILARLSQGAIGEENAALLGALIASKLHQVALTRQDVATTERRPFYLYMDEFQNFVTPSMEPILSGARKYRLGLIMAHQDLRQIQSRSPEVLSSVLANAGTRICFRVGDHDAKSLAEGFGRFQAQDLQRLAIGEAVVRIEGAGNDFNLRTEAPVPHSEDEGEGRAAQIRKNSRERFGRQVPAGPVAPSALEQPAVAASTDEAISKLPSETATVPPVRFPMSTTLGRTPQKSASPGRGGAQHKYLQELIRRWGEAHEWRVELEEPVLDGLGRVDVVLRKNACSVACEIGVSSSPDHELQNLLKCLAGGFTRALAISPDRKLLKRLESLATSSLTPEQLARVAFCAPEDALSSLEAIELEAAETPQSIRGYRVKVRVSAGEAAERRERRGAVSEVIAKAMRRLKEKSNHETKR